MNKSYLPRVHLLAFPQTEDRVSQTKCGKRGYLREEAMGNYIAGELNWLVTVRPENVTCVSCLKRMAK